MQYMTLSIYVLSFVMIDHGLACMNIFVCAKVTSNLYALLLHLIVCALLVLKYVWIRSLFLVFFGYLWVILSVLGLQSLLRTCGSVMRFRTLLVIRDNVFGACPLCARLTHICVRL